MPDLANGRYVSQSDALARWWPAAREVLVETARDYGAWITEEDLGARVQADTGVTTRQPADEWVPAILGRVAADAERRGEPRLASLCVRADLSVGEHPGAAPGETVQARERQAAQDRLDAYRAFGATMPADGGRPQLTPRTTARPVVRERPTRARSAARTPRPAPNGGMREVTCTECFMVVPVAERCRECGASLATSTT